MTEKLKKINPALPELMAGIFFFGLICQAVGVWLTGQKLIYSISLWLGILAALVMSYHMAWALSGALETGRADAEAKIRKQNLLRYGVLILLFAFILLTKTLNPLYTFLGVMGLKVGAYLQPFTHKVFNKLRR